MAKAMLTSPPMMQMTGMGLVSSSPVPSLWNLSLPMR